MRRDAMFALAKQELEHIPKGDYQQGVLRASYWMMRLNSLGLHREFPDDPGQLIERAVDEVHRLMPAAVPVYDKEYFGR